MRLNKPILTAAVLQISLAVFGASTNNYWGSHVPLRPHRLPLPPTDFKVTYEDLDNDGDPDVLKSMMRDGIPVQWIDDDDDMKEGDLEGDTDNDCLMVDRNKDGRYGAWEDFIIDWCDEDGDGMADLQVIADNNKLTDVRGGPGHHMIFIDNDDDDVFNYVDWNIIDLQAWDTDGLMKFYADYHGNSTFLKNHCATYNVNDTRYNWENPFLFYDFDGDKLTEMAVRILDVTKKNKVKGTFPEDANIPDKMRSVQYQGQANHAAVGWDLDNDNGPGNEFDFDFSLRFSGEGFSYSDQIHTYKSLRGLPEADKFFYDPRWRQQTELIYADHKTAWDLIVNRGKWEEVWFVYDEDDDCDRWERVEFYYPKELFITEHRKGGLNNHIQSDFAGDRGEWDLDNSGGGNLYIGNFDGRLHLYGAEWGAWRIDQSGHYRIHERWKVTGGQLWPEPPTFYATVRYEDTDKNGFIDQIEYDIDGDQKFEHTVSLKALGLSDEAKVRDIRKMEYKDFQKLHLESVEKIHKSAELAVKVAEKYGMSTHWYAMYKSPRSVREQYHYGYWLSFYIYMDMRDLAMRRQDDELLKKIDTAYFSSNWELLL